MYKDYLSTGWKNEIGTPRQVGSMQPVAITQMMKPSPQHHFGFGALRADTAHDATTHIPRDLVSHRPIHLTVEPTA